MVNWNYLKLEKSKHKIEVYHDYSFFATLKCTKIISRSELNIEATLDVELVSPIFTTIRNNETPNVLIAAIVGELVNDDKNNPIDAIDLINKTFCHVSKHNKKDNWESEH